MNAKSKTELFGVDGGKSCIRSGAISGTEAEALLQKTREQIDPQA